MRWSVTSWCMISFTAAAVLGRKRPSGLGARPAARDGRMDGRYVGASTPCFRPSGVAPRRLKLPCAGQVQHAPMVAHDNVCSELICQHRRMLAPS